MYVRSVHPSNNFDTYISGEVTIDPSAAIAPGVLLQASPNSRIIIGAGACIGLGTILHAYEGTLEVEAGANLGAGVLVVGKGKIGANACIGSTTTILNRSIEARQVVAAGSLIGDESRQAAVTQAGATNGLTDNSAPTPPEAAKSQTPVAPAVNGQTSDPTTDANAIPVASSANAQTTEEPTESETTEPETTAPKIYGQANLNRMLSTMFPHRKSLSRPLHNPESPSDKT